MRKTTLLKNLILSKEILVMPGAYDALSAKVIEKMGFKAVQCSGFGIAASVLGKPDVGILSAAEMLNQTRNICTAVSIPVMADGDTGFGNAINVYHTVQTFEAAGAAGLNLEDQVFPKRCGHMEGKEVIPLEEMVKKIRAAVDAKRDPDFVINARTDAIAVHGVEEAIRRGNAYAEAGADLIFVEAPPSVEDIKYIVKRIKAPVSINLTDGGKTPAVSIKQLQEWGVARVSLPVTPIFSAVKAMEKALRIVHEEGISPAVNHPEDMTTFEEFTDLVGLPSIRAMEREYLPDEVLIRKYR
ncbi:MAG: isocitrate lyase/PEP mutase family protein [Ignavibacteriales bacterium]